MQFIYNSSPHHMEADVKVDTALMVHWLLDLDVTKFKPEHLLLTNLTEQRIEEVAYTYNHRLLHVTPKVPLQSNAHYMLQIRGGTDGIRDIIGREMPDSYEMEFYTKSATLVKRPELIRPLDRTTVKSMFEIEVAATQEAVALEIQVSLQNTFHNPIWDIVTPHEAFESNLVLQPDFSLETKTYYVRVRAKRTTGEVSDWSPFVRVHCDLNPSYDLPEDPSPSPLVINSYSRAAEEMTQLSRLASVFADFGVEEQPALVVTEARPKDGSIHVNLERFNATGVGQNQKKIHLTFSAPIDPLSVNADSCYVLRERN